jgi:hypothetical protein
MVSPDAGRARRLVVLRGAERYASEAALIEMTGRIEMTDRLTAVVIAGD